MDTPTILSHQPQARLQEYSGVGSSPSVGRGCASGADGRRRSGRGILSGKLLAALFMLLQAQALSVQAQESPVASETTYQGQVIGMVASFDEVEVQLISPDRLRTTTPDSEGQFIFADLAEGQYAVKVSAPGYRTTPARLFRVPLDGEEETSFQLEQLSEGPFFFHWEEDQSTAGTEYSAHVNVPPVVEFLGETVTVADNSSADRLRYQYNILLVDSEGGIWSQEHAYRMLETMKSIPQETSWPKPPETPPSQWMLTEDFIENDIDITTHEDDSRTVLVSEAVFVNASPRIATVDGKRGVYYSQRLHHALVRFVTKNGKDHDAYDRILRDRFGLTTFVDDYYSLTAPTGHETSERFQDFHAEEAVEIINMLEEMPKGMHKVTGFNQLLRRLDGTPHPIYPQAPAVAWPTSGYVEFMESAFTSASTNHMHRLIIHEKAHFLWAHLFDEQLKADWIELGGWFEDSEAASGWSTTKTAEFVSAYAHEKNPNEDMAESISYFIINPDKLKSRSLAKYEFVRDRIMEGSIYLAQIREDLTFQVYNLFPDYVFPGKIRRVDITVEGEPEEDKTITLEFELHALDREAEGAENMHIRVFSSTGTYSDIWLFAVDEDGEFLRSGESLVLRGSKTFSKHAKAGYWLPGQVAITDAVGNQRFQGSNDFGWKLYVDNPLEDYTPPEYVPGTAALSVHDSPEYSNAQVIRATWKVKEDTKMSYQGCHAAINDDIPDTYSLRKWGEFIEEEELCQVDFLMPDYARSSVFSLDFILMQDEARNRSSLYFSGDFSDGEQHEAPQTIKLVTSNPDTNAPEVAINDIEIDAKPTNPEAPNGETIVTIRFQIRDDISGYVLGAMILRDPQGIDHFNWHYAPDRRELFPAEDPTLWKWHTYTRILPPGSAPGTWGLAEMTVYDRAGNFRRYDFTEIIHFEVE